MVASLPGHLRLGEQLDLPGEGVVDARTVLEQTDVFGKAPREEKKPTKGDCLGM